MLPFQKVHHNKEEASFLNCSSSSLYYTSSSFFQDAIFRVSELTYTPSHTTFLNYFQVSFLGVNISCDNQNWTQNSTNVFYVILNSLYIIYFSFNTTPTAPSPKASYWLFKLLLDTRQIFSPRYQSWLFNYFTMSSEPIRDYEKFRLFFPKCIILHLTKLNFICFHTTQSPSLLSFAWRVS